MPVEHHTGFRLPPVTPFYGEYMRQIKITTQNLNYPTDEDCILSPGDPIHDIKKTIMLGGLRMCPTLDTEDPNFEEKGEQS